MTSQATTRQKASAAARPLQQSVLNNRTIELIGKVMCKKIMSGRGGIRHGRMAGKRGVAHIN